MELVTDYIGTATIRRLLSYDMDEVQKLYDNIGRDAIWLDENICCTILKSGEFWGIVNKGKIATCCALSGADLPIKTAQMLFDQKFTDADSALILPPAGQELFWWQLLIFLRKRAAGYIAQLGRNCKDQILCVPTKTGAGFAKHCFAADMKMVAVRPLDRLRVNYIFSSKPCDKTDKKSSMTVSINDTLSLSRCLEHGYCAVGTDGYNFLLQKNV